MAQPCFYCGERVDPAERYVLMLGRGARPHCSEGCLARSLRNERRARARRRQRWALVGLGAATLTLAVGAAWRRFHAPAPEWISTSAPEPLPEELAAPSDPAAYGPAWPPTEEDWTFAFARGSWVYPLPGPVRRPATPQGQLLHTEIVRPSRPPPARGNADGGPPRCRVEGACGVDLGGELWGEHVYAARDGVVERVQLHGDDEGGGQSVRIAHYGGMAFTQYFHLAGTPRHIVRGARVRAGDVLGLLGDTGLSDGSRHLTFTLSTRPSPAFPEVYWDPSALMAAWPLRTPPRGTVAGFAPPRAARAEFPPRGRGR